MTNTQIGERIKDLRQRAGYTQNDLGKLLFLSGQSISKWENGESTPCIENIDQLCKVFRITPNELLDYKEEKNVTSSQYGGDMILQSSIICFFIMIVLYALGMILLYVLESIGFLRLGPIVGGTLWASAIVYSIYTITKNIFTFRRINGSYKHIVFISTLGLCTVMFLPLVCINIYVMISDMITQSGFGPLGFSSWFRAYVPYLILLLSVITIYVLILILSKKKYSKSAR